MRLFDWLTGRRRTERTLAEHAQLLDLRSQDIGRLKLAVDDLDFRLHRTLGQHTNEISHLRGQVKVLQTQRAGLAGRCEALEQAIGVAARACELLVTTGKELQARVETLERERSVFAECQRCVSPSTSTDAAIIPLSAAAADAGCGPAAEPAM
jgi:hypothetical protein